MEDKTEWDILMDADDTEEFIELTDIVEPDAGEDQPELDLDPLEEAIGPEMEFDEISLDEPAPGDNADAGLYPEESEGGEDIKKFSEEVPVDEQLTGAATLSPDQVVAALERVIEKKFAEKIESILFEVMERVIEKEIAEIRATLQKDLDNIDRV